MSVYEKKKYVWKILYIYMLGYDVDFGHMETMALISAPKYAEKQVYTLFKTLCVVVLCSTVVFVTGLAEYTALLDYYGTCHR